ncbi:hypothetical protein HH212_22485 [Massilia forsythiae]|uniref:Uncharacterized protein n=1 Tax=Massilia forsythiae TaxID=2728020 RepID=A0A7Z2W0D5_9BURK|nr:hypothetical protein [Massilia forsythiae]QJE02448.1 hypothetical protein HH212_22485 [Massilia forsythiae]
MQVETWVVADEYDDAALAQLKVALSDLQYTFRHRWSAIIGSQDVRQWEAVGPGGRLIIESETYMGLSVEGSASLVAELQARYEKASGDS